MNDKGSQVAEIRRLCAESRCPERAEEWIRQGLTPQNVVGKLLDLHKAGVLSTPAAHAAALIDMGKDAGRYSYQRAMAAAVAMREGRHVSGLEVDIHQEITKLLPQNYAPRGGIFVPMRVMNAVLTSSGSTTGAETVFQEYGEFIDLLRNMAVVTRLGALPLADLRGPIAFPRQRSASTAHWARENPEAGVAQSNPTLGSVIMHAKTLQAQGIVSRQLLAQSTPSAEGLFRRDLAAVHALAWDRAALHGSGADNQPLGIYQTEGVGVVSMGGVPTYDKLVDMETEIGKENALLAAPAFATTPEMCGKLQKVLDFPDSAAGRPIWTGNAFEGVVKGCRAISSNQVRSDLGGGSDEHGLLLGVWSELLIGMWTALEIIVDPFTLADKGLVKLTSFQMVDIALRNPEAFRKATGATIG